MCTAAENTDLGICLLGTSDAATADCNAVLFGADGGPTACANCIYTPATGTAWGAAIVVESPVGGTSTATTETALFDLGGCVVNEDLSSAGKACGEALNEVSECEFAACVAYCPVTSYEDGAGLSALLGDGTPYGMSSDCGCLGSADSTVCSEYATDANEACAVESNDAGTGPLDKCVTLIINAGGYPGSAAAMSAYLGEICGG